MHANQSRRSFRERLTTRLAHMSFLLTRPMTLGVRAAVIDRDDRVLLVKHGYVVRLALAGRRRRSRRDLSERAERANSPRRPTSSSKRRRCCTACSSTPIFAARSRRGLSARAFRVTGERAPDREIVAARFFPRDALPEGATQATRARLDEIFDSAPLSARW